VAVVLKLSPNRQLTLTKGIVEAMGSPSYFEAELVKRELILRPGVKLTLDEAELRFGKHGITQEVLTEALRIVARKEGQKG